MKPWLQKFIDIYDVGARVVKVSLLVLAVVILFVSWRQIDTHESLRRFVERETPVVLQSEKPPRGAEEPERDPLYIYQGSKPVLKLDRSYSPTSGGFTAEEALVVGEPDLSRPLEYRGTPYRVSHVQEYIGLLVSNRGARGPVLRGVTFTAPD